MKSRVLWRILCFIVIFLSTSFLANAQWLRQQVADVPNDYFFPVSIKFADANTGYMAGSNNSIEPSGTIYKTINGGVNWNKLTLNNIANNITRIRSIEVVSISVVYAAYDSSKIMKTTNGGNNWIILNSPNVTSDVIAWKMNFLNALTGWITTTNSNAATKLFQTTNGGTSWQSVNNSIGFTKIKYQSATNGFGISAAGLFTTTNAGVNWTNSLADSLLSEFYFLNNSTGWVFSKKSPQTKGKSWNTTNGGTSWNLLYSNDSSVQGPKDVIFFDAFTGYANYFIDKSGIIKTTNGGASWFNPTDFRLTYSPNYNIMAFVNQSTGWYSTGYDFVFKTATGAGDVVNPFFADYKKIQNSNNISSTTDAYGRLTTARDDGSNLPGLEFPKGSNDYCLFNSSLAISAVVNGDTLLSQNYASTDLRPGQFSGGNETGSRLGEYGLYQIKTGDGAGVSDYDHWPVSQGAPISSGQPMLTGNQSSFLTLTDMVRSSMTFTTAPLKAELKIYSYSFNDDLRKDAIYYKIEITNKNSSAWSNAYFSIIADPDIGETVTDDRMGSDSSLGLAYGYNGVSSDPQYGTTPPAVGYKFISGTSGFNLSSCVPFYNSNTPPPNSCWGEPGSVRHYRNFQNGLDECGGPYIYNSLPKKFVFNGDPQTGTGWNTSFNGDVRFFMNIGPGNLAPGQTATIIVAVLAARGTGYLNSVTKLKQYAASLPLDVQSVSSVIPKEYQLNQNYPNPFNPVTKISYSVPKTSFMELNVYDISGRLVKNLFSGNQQTGNYEVDFNGESLASGIYICRMNSENYSNSIKMILVK